MSVVSWWELPRYAYRPQYLQLALLLQEQQPPPEVRLVDLALSLPLKL